MRFGDAVVIDGAEVGLESRIDGGEVGLTNRLDGGEIGVYYNKGGTSDYEMLAHKPLINGVTLIGDRSIEDLGVETLTNTEILAIYNRVFGG